MGRLIEGFNLAPNTAVYTCMRVLDGAPILHVSHDENGDWQFLCGRDHSDEALCPGKIISLTEILKLDSSLSELSDLGPNWTASRNAASGEWALRDRNEDIVRKHIRDFGWHVTLVEPQGKVPGFAYSIGLYKTFKQPEVIIFGLPLNVMHSIINHCGEEFRAGRPIETGVPLGGFVQGFPVIFKDVLQEHYRKHFGYGLWFYSGPKFPAIQCIWPDKKGRYPWDPNYEESIVHTQPVIS